MLMLMPAVETRQLSDVETRHLAYPLSPAASHGFASPPSPLEAHANDMDMGTDNASLHLYFKTQTNAYIRNEMRLNMQYSWCTNTMVQLALNGARYTDYMEIFLHSKFPKINFVLSPFSFSREFTL